MGTSKRGQRQPYRVCTNFPPSDHTPGGSRVADSYVSLKEADHNGRERARYGGTSEMLYLKEDGTFLRMFVYTPDNVAAFDDDAEFIRTYVPSDVINLYRKHHGIPEAIDGLTVRNIRTIDRPVPDGTPTDKVVPTVLPDDEDDATPPLADFRRHHDDKETTMTEAPISHYVAPAADDGMTDEELWNSPLGQRLRTYADKILAAEQERLTARDKRQVAGSWSFGVGHARSVLSPLGSVDERNENEDPWVYWQSPEVEGLRAAVQATDGSPEAAQEAAKAYIASLQGDDRPMAEETTKTASTDGDEEPATPMDVEGALSYLLTGNAVSDRGPFVIHEGDGFHSGPYVMLPLDAMSKILDEIPKERW